MRLSGAQLQGSIHGRSFGRLHFIRGHPRCRRGADEERPRNQHTGHSPRIRRAVKSLIVARPCSIADSTPGRTSSSAQP